MVRNSGEPLAGGSVSGGTGRPDVYRSRTYQLIPPHRPLDASPMPTQRGSSGPNCTVGPCGQRLAKCSPWTLGRKPGIAFDTTIDPESTPRPHRIDAPAARTTIDGRWPSERARGSCSTGGRARRARADASRCCSRTRADRSSPSATSATGRSRRASRTGPTSRWSPPPGASSRRRRARRSTPRRRPSSWGPSSRRVARSSTPGRSRATSIRPRHGRTRSRSSGRRGRVNARRSRRSTGSPGSSPTRRAAGSSPPRCPLIDRLEAVLDGRAGSSR